MLHAPACGSRVRGSSGFLISTKLTPLDSLRGSSVKIGTIQRRLAWPQDDTHKSRSVSIFCPRCVEHTTAPHHPGMVKRAQYTRAQGGPPWCPVWPQACSVRPRACSVRPPGVLSTASRRAQYRPWSSQFVPGFSRCFPGMRPRYFEHTTAPPGHGHACSIHACLRRPPIVTSTAPSVLSAAPGVLSTAPRRAQYSFPACSIRPLVLSVRPWAFSVLPGLAPTVF